MVIVMPKSRQAANGSAMVSATAVLAGQHVEAWASGRNHVASSDRVPDLGRVPPYWRWARRRRKVSLNGTDSANCLQTAGGGAQITGWSGLPTETNTSFGRSHVWGNDIVNYAAASTADDSLALANDLGGQTACFTANVHGSSVKGTASYPATIINANPAIGPANQSNSATISNSFVRFVGGYNVSTDIDEALLTFGSVTTINSFTPLNQAWQAFQGSISLTATLQNPNTQPMINCDPRVIVGGCPVLLTIDAPPAGGQPPVPPNF